MLYNFVPNESKLIQRKIYTRTVVLNKNLVRKIRQHIGGQFLDLTNLRKSAGHAQQGSSLTLHRVLVKKNDTLIFLHSISTIYANEISYTFVF